MYQIIKKIIKAVLPKKILDKQGAHLREINRFIYQGSNFQCNICEAQLRKFIVIPNDPNTICPVCGSLSRTRRLWSIVKDHCEEKKLAVLDFSPSDSFSKKMKRIKNIDYIDTDFVGEFKADRNWDICQLPLEENSIDMVLCYHVLEHVEDDKKAMKELYRVLKNGGIGFIQTPFQLTPIDEDSSISNEIDRVRIYGQKDHVRVYSINSLSQKLELCNLKVKHLQYAEELENKFGFKEDESVLHIRK